jgi:hypothetical protein
MPFKGRKRYSIASSPRLPYETMPSKSFKRKPVGKGLNYEAYQVYLNYIFPNYL